MKCMKNKGFTLVELLAVLSIIGVVAILVMPTMLEALRNGKTMLKKFDKQGVLDAGEKKDIMIKIVTMLEKNLMERF